MCAGVNFLHKFDLLDKVKLRYDIKTFINAGVMVLSLVEAMPLKTYCNTYRC